VKKNQSMYLSIKVNVTNALLFGITAEIPEKMDWNNPVYVKIRQATFFYGEALIL